MITYTGFTGKNMRSQGLYEPEEIFNAMTEAFNQRKNRAVIGDFSFKVNSHRLELFYHRGLKCVTCGLEANVFSLESQADADITPHLNLYHKSEDGAFTLFTKDHIIPRWYGGPNHFENYNTMCAKCNAKKSNARPTDQEIEEVTARLDAANVPYELNIERLAEKES